MSTTLTVTCHGCGEPFEATHWRAKWCSERCRKSQYSATCVRCGWRDNGSEGRRTGEFVCGRCRHEEQYGTEAALIADLWREGLSGEAIAGALGLSYEQVRGRVAYMQERGVLDRHSRPRRELWPLIECRAREGVTMAEIAAEAGTTKENVNQMARMMRAAGIEVRFQPRGGRRA